MDGEREGRVRVVARPAKRGGHGGNVVRTLRDREVEVED